MRKLPLYIRTVKGRGKRRRKRKSCKRCNRKNLRGGKSIIFMTKKEQEEHAKKSLMGRWFRFISGKK